MTELNKRFKPLDYERFLGQQVRVHRNLHLEIMYGAQKRYALSVQIYIPRKGFMLAGHTTDLALKDVSFIVSDKCRQRALLQQRRKVHAFAIGTLIPNLGGINTPIEVSYNYRKAGYFFSTEGFAPISRAKFLVVEDCIVRVSPDALQKPEPTPLERWVAALA